MVSIFTKFLFLSDSILLNIFTSTRNPEEKSFKQSSTFNYNPKKYKDWKTFNLPYVFHKWSFQIPKYHIKQMEISTFASEIVCSWCNGGKNPKVLKAKKSWIEKKSINFLIYNSSLRSRGKFFAQLGCLLFCWKKVKVEF